MEQKNLKILATFSTYNRYDSILPLTILSIAQQTRVPDHLIIYDDSKEPREFWKEEKFAYLMTLISQKGISWEINPGWKQGAHHNHETANQKTGYDYVWMLDDDHCPDPTCLEELLKEMKDGVGAVAPLILKPGIPISGLPANVDNKIDNIYAPNMQWFNWRGEPKEVEHLYSSFLYRPGIVHHDTRLSSKVFRGETMFTHSLFRKGYKLIITPKAVMWHLEESRGGCRTQEEDKSNQEKYNSDHIIFMKWLTFQKMNKFLVVLNNGKGDHVVFKKDIYPRLKEKYGDNLLMAVNFRDIFPEEKNLISPADAEMFVNLRDYDVYGLGMRLQWKGPIKELYEKLYFN